MLARLIALLTSGEISVVKRRVKTAVIAYILLAVFAVLALIFLLLAAYLAAAVRWGAIASALWFGVGFVVLGGVVFLAYKMVARRQRRAQQYRRAADSSMIAGASAVAMLPTLFGRKGGVTGLLVAVVGLAGYATYRAYERRSGKKDH